MILDQWDLNLGGDLALFMEKNLTKADRVLVICTGTYVLKANEGNGGVGYEKMILTGQLMGNISSDRIIPIIRRSDGYNPVPIFLASRLYIDFRDDEQFEVHYNELLHEIHGEKLKPKPPLGPNPFLKAESNNISADTLISEGRYKNPNSSGTVTFDYSNNNGKFTIGMGDKTFETLWSGASNHTIHAYNDAPSIDTIALAENASEFIDIKDFSSYDTSSRVRTPKLGEIIIWRNNSGYHAATKILALKSRGHGDDRNEITFDFAIENIQGKVEIPNDTTKLENLA